MSYKPPALIHHTSLTTPNNWNLTWNFISNPSILHLLYDFTVRLGSLLCPPFDSNSSLHSSAPQLYVAVIIIWDDRRKLEFRSMEEKAPWGVLLRDITKWPPVTYFPSLSPMLIPLLPSRLLYYCVNTLYHLRTFSQLLFSLTKPPELELQKSRTWSTLFSLTKPPELMEALIHTGSPQHQLLSMD